MRSQLISVSIVFYKSIELWKELCDSAIIRVTMVDTTIFNKNLFLSKEQDKNWSTLATEKLQCKVYIHVVIELRGCFSIKHQDLLYMRTCT